MPVLKNLSIVGDNVRLPESSVDSKSWRSIRDFLFGKEEVTGSILVEDSRFACLRS